MKTIDYDEALARFRKFCNRNYDPQEPAKGRPSKIGLKPGVITESAKHYSLKISQMSAILLRSRGKVMTEKMLADIGLKRESVLIKK